MNADNDMVRQRFRDELTEDIFSLEEELFILKECLFCYDFSDDTSLIDKFIKEVSINLDITTVEALEEIWKTHE